MDANPYVELPDRINAATVFLDEHVASGKRDKVAIYFGDAKYTYGDLLHLANRAGNLLKDLGVEVENRVMLLLLDTPEFIAAFLGAMKIGAVPIPVNTLLRAADYEYLLNDSRAKILIVHEALLGEIEKVIANLKHLRGIVLIGGPRRGYWNWEELMAKASDELEAADTSKDDAAFWLYSSGSTGFPKGAVHLHHNLVYLADLYPKAVLEIEDSDICFSVPKLFFAYGLGASFYFPFRVGAASVFNPKKPVPEEIFQLIDRYRPTIFYCVPTMYAQLLQVKDAEKRFDLSSVKKCISAGEALPPEIFNKWNEKFGLEILDGIGSTEVGHIFISNRSGSVKVGSSGTVVSGYEAKIVDENGAEVGPPGEVGNLMIKGDTTAPYYWNKHRRTLATMVGEWIYTGDKYYRDQEGYYWYCGRSDDMMKVGGIWVSPIEVENTLISHPAVLECAVVAAIDENRLTKPKAYVVLKDGFKASGELEVDIRNFVKDKIAPYKYPRWVEFVAELPKTATGKIQRFKLRD